jgi:hypothetical protein
MSLRKTKTAKSESPVRQNSQDQGALLRRAIKWIVDAHTFLDLRTHGNTKWQANALVSLAVLTAWTDAPQMTAAFEKAAKLSHRLFGVVAIATFQGLMRALVTYGPQLISRTWTRLQTLMQEVAPEHYRIGTWLPLAVDGSRFTTPRTVSNELAFAARNFGQGKDARSRCNWKNKHKRSKKLCTPVKPQIWLTLIWHMGLKLPWCWKTGPSTSSERHHLMEMIATLTFPENTLFCCDAGFVGYELWSTLMAAGHHFLIRVGGNVRLLRNLGRTQRGDGVVFLWPHDVAKRRQPPLMLRLIEIKNERGRMFLVTDVLSQPALSTSQLKRLYLLRWGIELQFRTIKQTYGRGTLRSRKADHALAELEWSLIALTMIQLLAIREQIQFEIPPERASVAQAIRAIQHAIDTWNETLPRAERLPSRLRQATKDDYNRATRKAARYRPDYKDKPTATQPIVINATKKQMKNYAALQHAA